MAFYIYISGIFRFKNGIIVSREILKFVSSIIKTCSRNYSIVVLKKEKGEKRRINIFTLFFSPARIFPPLVKRTFAI